ncbi:hypothetical protein DRN73_08070 [Candidatus Pacearchaeota archaeon]|nr:MAG: hypothetical protein DRN73_08070 [Candidatus Pacearchaeota archaeon]
MTDIINVKNPTDIIPDERKINFAGVRRRDFTIGTNKTTPALGWTNGQKIEFSLASDVGILDWKKGYLTAKFAIMGMEKGKIVGGTYGGSGLSIGDFADNHVNYSTFNTTAGARVWDGIIRTTATAVADKTKEIDFGRYNSLLSMDYGVLGLFKTMWININDKELVKIEDYDLIQKFTHLTTSTTNRNDEFTKFGGGDLCGDSFGNVDNYRTSAERLGGEDLTFFDIVINVGSLLDEFPLLPLYKVNGDIKIGFTINDSLRAMSPNFNKSQINRILGTNDVSRKNTTTYIANPYYPVCAGGAMPLYAYIKWSEQPKFEWFFKDIKFHFTGLDLLTTDSKDSSDITRHFLDLETQVKNYTATKNGVMPLDTKIPSIRYMFFMLQNNYAETMIIAPNEEYRLAKRYSSIINNEPSYVGEITRVYNDNNVDDFVLADKAATVFTKLDGGAITAGHSRVNAASSNPYYRYRNYTRAEYDLYTNTVNQATTQALGQEVSKYVSVMQEFNDTETGNVFANKSAAATNFTEAKTIYPLVEAVDGALAVHTHEQKKLYFFGMNVESLMKRSPWNLYSMTWWPEVAFEEYNLKVGNLNFPSDTKYYSGLESYLELMREFNGWTISSGATSSPYICYGSKPMNFANYSRLDKMNGEGLYGSGKVSKSITNPMEGNINKMLKDNFSTEHGRNFDGDVMNELYDLSSIAEKGIYFLNLSKILGKGKSINGMLDSEFNQVNLNYKLKYFLAKNDWPNYLAGRVNNNHKIDINWRQIILKDAQVKLNAATGSFEIYN